MDAAGQDVEGAPVLFMRWMSLNGEHDCGLDEGLGLRRRGISSRKFEGVGLYQLAVAAV